jgi:NifB/MoaA-like Fe-S oxidoreductase
MTSKSSPPVVEVLDDQSAVGADAPITFIRRRPVPRGYETIDSILLTEPRIEAIRRELQALLNVIELEADGHPVAVDGFRLRKISDWADYPTSLSDIFWHLSSVCNFRCDFCYEKGNPPDFPIQNTPRMASPGEIETRLSHYDVASGRGIFSVRTSINEPFANRQAVDYLRRMRAKSPDEVISFVTNGSYITDEVARSLKELQPIFFNLSVYSTDPAIRRDVLGDRRGDTAILALDLLMKHQVPYMTNLVMWPSIPFADMEKTIAHVAERRATVIRVCLGGYSRYLRGRANTFRADDYWPEVVAEVERIRDRYPIPILIEPNSFVRQDTDAVVDGVIQDSPAQRAGIKRGDVILAANGRPVASRIQLLSELRRTGRTRFRPPGVIGLTATIRRRDGESVALRVERASRQFDVVLNRYDASSIATYPYGEIASFDDFIYGLVVTDSLRYSSLRAARQIIERRGSHSTLILTSALIEPILRQMVARTAAFGEHEVEIRVAENRFFGGTINIGDLLVVDDFVYAIEEAVRGGSRPDLVLVPGSPFATSPWGRDLAGEPWTAIQRKVGIPVERIDCAPLVF